MRPQWTEVRREIADRRTRLVTRLRAHLRWLERREKLLEHLPAERIVAEIGLTKQADARARAEVAAALAELNALVRRHNLMVTATSLHLRIVTFESLLETARRPRGER